VDQRAEDFLVREYAGLRRGQEGLMVVGGGGEWDRLAPAEGALAALIAVGAVSEEEARLWRNRFGEASEVRSEQLPAAAVRERGDAYVAQLLAALPRDRMAGLGASAELQDVLNALHHVGVFSGRAVDRWFDRLGKHVGSTEALPDEETERACRLSELRRVIVGPPERRGGVRVLGFEVYDDAVVLRWHLVRLAPDDQGRVSRLPDEVEDDSVARRAREPSFMLHDDCETVYRVHSGGAGSAGSSYGSRVWSGSVTFTPTLPAAARRLSAVSERFHFEVVV
jgi:hypothetical protein